MKDKIIVAVAGMPGSGKAAFRRVLTKMCYHTVTMGDVIREEAKIRNLEPTPENLGTLMLNLRAADGPAAIAKRCIPKLEKATERIVGVDGIRSLPEVNLFKTHFPKFVLVALHASPKTRYQRLFRRKRSDDPQDWETFMERDLRELGVGMGDVIATADHMIVNEGTFTKLNTRIKQVLKEILEG
ncbi:MAG: flagellar hook-basal body complex protein FliE [Candidatus Bathyarchaeota archaeon]|nr:flagellar hook-basal body complex protein FliE [Candidatus Bathyarchaeum sp.]